METKSDDVDCCIICLNTSSDSQLISVEAKTADDINKLFYVEIVNAESGGPRICITCLYTVEKAAILKDCIQKHGKFFKSTLKKVQDSKEGPGGLFLPNTDDTQANQCPGCAPITRSEFQSVEIGSSVECVKQLVVGVEIAQRYDQVHDEYDCNENPVPSPTEVKIEETSEGSTEKLNEGVDIPATHIRAEVNKDNVEMVPTWGGDTSSSVTADSEPSGEMDRGEAETSGKNVDIEILLPTTILIKDEDYAPEIASGKADSLDKFIDNNVKEDLNSGGSSKEVAQAGTQQERRNELNGQCGFQAVSPPVLSAYQAFLASYGATSFKPMTSIPESNLLDSESSKSKIELNSETVMNDDEEEESDSSIDVDDDESSDYVTHFGDSAEGCSTSGFSMQTRRSRRRCRPQDYFEREYDQPLKMRKVKKQTSRRSKRVVEESEESEESDNEPLAKKIVDRRASRRVSKPPRRYSPERVDPRESRRRSRRSKKFVKESAAGRSAPKRSSAMILN